MERYPRSYFCFSSWTVHPPPTRLRAPELGGRRFNGSAPESMLSLSSNQIRKRARSRFYFRPLSYRSCVRSHSIHHHNWLAGVGAFKPILVASPTRPPLQLLPLFTTCTFALYSYLLSLQPILCGRCPQARMPIRIPLILLGLQARDNLDVNLIRRVRCTQCRDECPVRCCVF
jgi:hypothetical protein